MGLILAANLLAPNLGLFVWITLTFLVLLFLLRRYAWGPITSALAAREEKIQTAMDRADKALAEAKLIQADNDRARREAEAEAKRLLRESREAADHLRQEEIERTREQIRVLQTNAQAEIARERDGALQSLRDEVADLAILAAERVLDANLDDDRQRKLVTDFLGDLPNN
jgi:F-type H+-transporting ATPase subunit b